MKDLRITFLLHGSGHLPNGGMKVAFEYANQLSRRGHRVTLVHPAINPAATTATQKARGTTAFILRSLTRGFHPRKWYPLDPTIRVLWVPTLSSRFVPDADIVIATAWETAEWLISYPRSRGDKHYLIQSWEIWSGPEARVRATWKAPLKRIVVARWLRDMADQLGVECTYIPNGVDSQEFGLDTPIESRNPNRVMMLHHLHPVKGTADGLEALSLVRSELPDLRVTLFGYSPAPALPAWAEYHRLPSRQTLRALYNQTAVFVSPGRIEGWPLPPAEAMLCGAALAATDIGGHREYGIDGETALLSPARDPKKLAENVLRLVRNAELRTKVARQGYERIRKCSWDEAVDSLERLLDHGPARQGNAQLVPALDGQYAD